MPLQISISNSIGGGGGSQGGAPTPAYSNEYSFLFDGVDDYVDCGDFSAYDNGDFSCSIWVYKTTSNDTERFISNSGASAKAGFDIVMDRYENIYVQRNTRTSDTASGYIAIGFTLNNWHHITATYEDSTKTLKIYLDGVLKDTTIGSASTNSASIPLSIGCYSSGVSQFFTGNIDEVSIFNSELSASDVTDIFNLGVPTSLSSYASLVSWWRMGENATWDGVRDWTLVDQGSGANNGLTQNMVEASRVADVPPNFNINSFLFDGVDDIFEGSTIYSEMNGGTKLTLSVWLKPISGAPTLEYALSNPRDTTANNSQFALILYEGNSVQFNVQGFNSQYVSGNIGAVTYGAWNHILICVDLSRTIGTEGIMFINGVDETTTSAMGTLSSFYTATDVLHIGVDANGGYNRFNGNIDELSIWSGSDLRSASDVSSIYNSGVPSDLNNTSGIAVPTTYFRMGEQSTFGSQWSMTDINGSYAVTSSNMVLASRTTDIP